MAQSTLQKYCDDIEYWRGLIVVKRTGAREFQVTPSENWREDEPFGFHFARECVPLAGGVEFSWVWAKPSRVPAKLMRILTSLMKVRPKGTYRLVFSREPDLAEECSEPMAAALWLLLVEKSG